MLTHAQHLQALMAGLRRALLAIGDPAAEQRRAQRVGQAQGAQSGEHALEDLGEPARDAAA